MAVPLLLLVLPEMEDDSTAGTGATASGAGASAEGGGEVGSAAKRARSFFCRVVVGRLSTAAAASAAICDAAFVSATVVPVPSLGDRGSCDDEDNEEDEDEDEDEDKEADDEGCCSGGEGGHQGAELSKRGGVSGGGFVGGRGSFSRAGAMGPVRALPVRSREVSDGTTEARPLGRAPVKSLAS
jgi:hypothetical protein